VSWTSLGYSASSVLVAAAVVAAGVAGWSVAQVPPGEEPPRVQQPGIEPLYVRPLMPIEPGRNDSNPVWSASGALIAFERSRGDKKEIVIARPDGTVMQTIYYQLAESSAEPKFFFPGVVEDTSYNAGITWSPTGDRLVFMSNAGTGNYDLYLRGLDGKTARLTDHKEKDGQAHWAPTADQLVFVSGRTGQGDLYLLDLATRAVTRLTFGDAPYLYPQWSPDGRKVAMIRGSDENHDIYVIEDVRKPRETLRALTEWPYDDLRPVWSPDGKKIAFYSNYNPARDPKVWAILVVASDGSHVAPGDGLAAKVVATDVVPDVERGPAWMADSNGIVYVKNDRQEYNPIYIANLTRKTNLPLKTETHMNHDIATSAQGIIAFRAQVDQWDQIFLAKLRD